MTAGSSSERSRIPVYVAQVAALALVHFAAGKLGLLVALGGGNISPLWPPAGVALAALLIFGMRLWPGVALGALALQITEGYPSGVIAALVAGKTLEPVAGVWLLRRAGFRNDLGRPRDAVTLVVLGGLLATTISATLGRTALSAGDVIPWGGFGSDWALWWLGDAAGVLVAGSACLAWAARAQSRWRWLQTLEFATLMLAVGLTALFVFGVREEFPYLVFPILILASYRFLQLGAATGVLVASGTAVWFTTHGSGPFERLSDTGTMLHLTSWFATASVTFLMLAAIISEGRRAERRVRARARQQSAVAEIGRRELSGVALPTLMDEAVLLVAETLGVEYAKVLELLPDGERLLLRAGVGWQGDAVGKATVGTGLDSQAGYTLRADGPVVVEDLRTESRFSGPPLLRSHGVVSGMSVVISGREGPFGVLGAHSATRREFSEDDVNFLRSVANSLGAMIERTQAEEERDRVTRALRALSECGQAMMRANDEQELLDDVCQILVSLEGYRLAWVGYAHEDRRRTVRPVARAGVDDGYVDRLDVRWDESEEGQGPTGTAVRSDEPVIARDLLTHPAFDGLQEAVAERGYASMISLPLRSGGRVGGVLNVYGSESDAFTEEEVELLAALASDLAYGLDVLRTRAERERAERELREAEERYRRLVERLPAVVYVERVESRGILYVSPQIEDLLGYGPEEWAQAPAWVRALHPEDRERVRAEDELSERTGRPFSTEYRLIAKDGRVVWVRDRATLILDEKGEPLFWQGAMFDITAQKEAETALAESEKRFRRLAENAPDLIFRHRLVPEPAFDYVSPAVMAITGCTAEELYADPGCWARAIHPEDRALLDEVLLESAPREEPVTLRWIHEGGRITWSEVRSTPISVESGNVVAVEGIVRDITARKLADEELRLQAAALEAAANAIVITDRAGVIRWVNPAFTSMTGYSLEEAAGQTPRILKSGRSDPDLYEDLWATILGGRVWEGNLVNQRKDGTFYLDEQVITPVLDEHGEVSRFVAIKQDVTDRRRAEEELRQSFELLRRTDDERRRLLSRLVAAQEEERSRIAADIHDDSIQIMTAAGMRLEILRRQLDDPKTQATIEQAENTIASAIGRLRHLLFELRPRPLDQEGVAAALGLYLADLQSQSEIECHLENQLVEEPDKETRTILYRIAQEALANVRKHSLAKRLEVRLESSNGGFLTRIRDDGVGFSGSEADSRPGHLGLSTMRERAEMAHGWWRLESTPDAGTTVEFWLPARPSAEPREVTPSA